jgi:hypothetical protein
LHTTTPGSQALQTGSGWPTGKLFFLIWLLFSFLAKTQCRELQNKFCKHLGHLGSTIICGHRTSDSYLAMLPACAVPELSETVTPPVPRLPQWAVGASDCSHMSSSWDHIRELAHTKWPIPPRKAWAQALVGITPKTL